jgi:hypothetical protein
LQGGLPEHAEAQRDDFRKGRHNQSETAMQISPPRPGASREKTRHERYGVFVKEIGDKLMPFGPKITAFLAAIRVMPNVTRAAHAAKINKSLHYAKLKSSPEYAAAFQNAMQMGCDALSDVAVTRATEGWEEPVVFQGRIALQEDPRTGKVVPVTVRRIDNQLLRFILERRHPDYRERVEQSGAVDIHLLMENLNAGRQRVAEEEAERNAEETAKRDATPPEQS